MAATTAEYDYLDTVILTGSWAAEGVFHDPGTVTFYTKNPAGLVRTYVFGIDSEVSRVSTGKFECQIVVDVPGRWDYRVYGSGGAAPGADEAYFKVRQSPFAP